MFPAVGFLLFLVITLVFLSVAVVTGLKASRKRHFVAVAGAVISLLITIYWAERLGTLYDLDEAGFMTPLHLTVAKATSVAYLLPVITGLRTIKNSEGRKFHGRIAFGVLILTVFTAVTGVLMVLMSEPLTA